ncbi:MAG: hypothetical protein ACKVP4_14395 [Hyphomicrobium sp.]
MDVGQFATSSVGHRPFSVSRREILLWLFAILAINNFYRVLPTDMPLVTGIFTSLTAVSVIWYLAWFVAFQRLSRANSAILATGADVGFAIATCLAICATMVVPTSGGAGAHWVVATVIAIYCFVVFHDDRNIILAATILMALSANGLWGPAFFHIFSNELLRADAALVGFSLSYTHPDIQWQGTMIGKPGQHVIVVAAPCSSFHNISLAILCWVTVTILERGRFVRSDAWTCLAVCLSMIILNACRIYLMALNYEGYDYWHNGFGAQIFEIASTATVLILSIAGARIGATRA